MRNKYVNACRAQKANYYTNLAEKLSKEGGVYKVLKRNKRINDLKIDCPESGLLVEDNRKIAEIFRNVFVNKTSELENMSRSNLIPIFDILKTTLGNVVPWDVGEITVEETLKALDSLKPTMSAGPDRISNRLIKGLKFIICNPFTKVANVSLETGIFPSLWKQGNVIPIHKKESRLDPNNYRPVSLMSNLGKLLELLVLRKIELNIDQILAPEMHGFRNNRGTETALVSLLDKVKDLKCKNKKVAIVALDCSSAFDLLDHSLVLGSLEAMGAGPRMLAWSESFLSGCKYSLVVGSACSETWSSKLGAGQGRRFSPVFFNVGSITMPLWDSVATHVIFANDSCSIVSGDNHEQLNENINSVVKNREEWYRLAGFQINGKKSELIGFGCSPSPVTIDGFLVKPKKQIKFLGLTISSNLGWKDHTSKLCGKIRLAANMIRVYGRFFL